MDDFIDTTVEEYEDEFKCTVIDLDTNEVIFSNE